MRQAAQCCASTFGSGRSSIFTAVVPSGYRPILQLRSLILIIILIIILIFFINGVLLFLSYLDDRREWDLIRRSQAKRQAERALPPPYLLRSPREHVHSLVVPTENPHLTDSSLSGYRWKKKWAILRARRKARSKAKHQLRKKRRLKRKEEIWKKMSFSEKVLETVVPKWMKSPGTP